MNKCRCWSLLRSNKTKWMTCKHKQKNGLEFIFPSSAVCSSACELPCLEQLGPWPLLLQVAHWAAAWQELPRCLGWMAGLPRWHRRMQRRSDSHERPVDRHEDVSLTRHENERKKARRRISRQVFPQGSQQQNEELAIRQILWQLNTTSRQTKRCTTESPSKAPTDVTQQQSPEPEHQKVTNRHCCDRPYRLWQALAAAGSYQEGGEGGGGCQTAWCVPLPQYDYRNCVRT